MKSKSKRLWGKLKDLLVEQKQYEPEIVQLEIFPKQIMDEIIIYDINGIVIKQSNKKLFPEKDQLNTINENEIDNTGAFYWPSEQILTKYILEHLDLLQFNKIIELGAGRSGFCGLVLAKKGFEVTLTDGNANILDELKYNAQLNDLQIPIEVLKWQAGECYINTVALISDCFFFEKYHDDLVKTLQRFKQTIGAAPSRGGSLERFLQKCSEVKIDCKQIDQIHETKIILFTN